MDISAQIKNSLISRIQASNDLNFLKALQTLFDTSEESLYELNEGQERSIQIGREQIKNGQFHKNEDVISEMREWLSKK
jgi:hypothetical protein